MFGAIRPKQVLKTLQQHGGAISAGVHVPRSAPSTPTTELMDDPDREEEYDRTAETDHDFSSPVGGGGAIGRLLQRLFSMVRDVKGGDSPGADAASHWTRSGTRAGTRAVYSVLDIDTLRHTSSSESDGGVRTGGGLLYPEWNCHRHRYHPAWCTVQELDVTLDHSVTVEWAQQHQLRRPLLRLARGMMRHPRQRQGDDIDIDAVIESQLGVGAGLPQDEAVYLESQRRRRDLSVLILLDISGSVAQPGVDGVAIHEQQRKVAASLLRALHEVGDRVALYGFHSQGKSEVHLAAVKRFDEVLGSTVMKRLFSLKPGAYSRLGAAVRHGVSQLLEQGGTPRKLLLVISDGLAYDHGYEPVYAAADVHQALGEARTHGVGCVCLGVGSMTEVEALQQVFGSAAYAVIPHPQDISRCIGPLFETALMNAEIQRQIA
ncbi:nitric oxide reductase activation protein NorD [Ketobacter sp.]|uniref:nitric oxide reductase activation protein NorD n=1 Tax=Ketobacter sp. TaxID=2083498 RepID=UPI0025BCF82D|nr:VWA domain-containing protein [Ketobacter sp.]